MTSGDDYDNELLLSHCSCASWPEPGRWLKYFSHVQEILGAEITHLDENDPIRRRVKPGGLSEAAEYAAALRDGDQYRWLFGRMAKIGVYFSILYYPQQEPPPNTYPQNIAPSNYIDWHAPRRIFNSPAGLVQASKLFDCGNYLLDAFYGYADVSKAQKRKLWKKKEFGAIDLRCELIGVFWLTYFNERYVEFFGREKFEAIRNADVRLNGGATLRLAQTPQLIPEGRREEIEAALCGKSFVSSDRDVTIKLPGQYALTFEQLRS